MSIHFHFQETMKCHSGSLVLFTIFLYAGCASSPSVPSLPVPTPIAETAPDASVIPPHTSWKITPSSQPQSYSSILTTVVAQTNIETQRQDTLTIRGLYSIRTTRTADSLSFSGSITGFTVQGPMTGTLESQPTLPILFTGKISNHNIRAQGPDDLGNSLNSCNNTFRAPMTMVQRNLFLTPLELIDQQVWTDSTSSIICSGTIPVVITSIRTFHVIGESDLDGNPALVIDENERTFSKGEGSQGQHRVLLETQGSTNGRLYLDRSSGQLLTANLINKTSVSVQSSGRVQYFSQNSTEIVQRTRD